MTWTLLKVNIVGHKSTLNNLAKAMGGKSGEGGLCSSIFFLLKKIIQLIQKI